MGQNYLRDEYKTLHYDKDGKRKFWTAFECKGDIQMSKQSHSFLPSFYRLIGDQRDSLNPKTWDADAMRASYLIEQHRSEMGVFLLNNDWNAALGFEPWDLVLVSHDIKLPFPFCVFEMKINGFNTVIAFKQLETRISIEFVASSVSDWRMKYGTSVDFGVPVTMTDATESYMFRQCISALIAMDSGIPEVIRVDVDASKASRRERAGKTPLFSHHILRIPNKSNVIYLRPQAEPQGKVRLHFRRGNWAHYQTPEGIKRVWRKWCLVGNPDLGFIDKEYSV